MTAHLAEIGDAVASGAHAVLVLESAGWHGAAALKSPDNITLLLLPPHSPDLAPVENVRQFRRDNCLSNRVSHSYDDIVAHCCAGRNKLADQPQRFRSIDSRSAHEPDPFHLKMRLSAVRGQTP